MAENIQDILDEALTLTGENSPYERGDIKIVAYPNQGKGKVRIYLKGVVDTLIAGNVFKSDAGAVKATIEDPNYNLNQARVDAALQQVHEWASTGLKNTAPDAKGAEQQSMPTDAAKVAKVMTGN